MPLDQLLEGPEIPGLLSSLLVAIAAITTVVLAMLAIDMTVSVLSRVSGGGRARRPRAGAKPRRHMGPRTPAGLEQLYYPGVQQLNPTAVGTQAPNPISLAVADSIAKEAYNAVREALRSGLIQPVIKSELCPEGEVVVDLVRMTVACKEDGVIRPLTEPRARTRMVVKELGEEPTAVEPEEDVDMEFEEDYEEEDGGRKG